jgi:hypothetical protein
MLCYPRLWVVFDDHAMLIWALLLKIAMLHNQGGHCRTMNKRIFFTVFTIFFLCTALPMGCGGHGPELCDVQGIISLDGKALAGATVIFEPKAGGRASSGRTDALGHYRLIYIRETKGALIGSHIVKIFTASEDNPKERLPARFNDKSMLTAELTRGDNICNFSLTSK